MIVELNAKQAYGQQTKPTAAKSTPKGNIFKSAPQDTVVITGGATGAKSNHISGTNSVDKINLSVGMSIDDVNRLMMSEVGKKVEAMFEEAGIDPAAVAETDWSPEATAERIFRSTTGLFEIWKSQNKEMSEEELIDSFESVLRKSVDQGANEAIGLIEARGFEKEESVVSTARETVSLVHNKFDDYFESLRTGLEEAADSSQKEAE